MVCSKCGAALRENAKFCVTCGEKVVILKKTKSRRKVLLGVMSAVAVTIFVIVAAVLGMRFGIKGTEEGIGNSAGNIANGGRVAGQGNWNYYVYCNSIMKIDDEGNTSKILSGANASSLNLIGDWLYYGRGSDIYKVRTDGTKNQLIVSNVYRDFFVADSSIYFIRKDPADESAYELASYSIKDGKVRVWINELKSEIKDSPGRTRRNYRFLPRIVGLYGKDLLPVVEFSDGRLGKIENDEMVYFNVGEGFEYFFVEGERLFGFRKSHGIFSANPNGEILVYNLLENKEEKHLVYDGWIEELNATGETLIFAADNAIKIHNYSRVEENLANNVWDKIVVMEEGNSSQISVVGNWIYYFYEAELYRVDINGQNRQKLQAY